MKEPERGMLVIGQGGQIGTVESLISEGTDGPSRVLVRRHDGQSMLLEPGTYQVEGNTVQLLGNQSIYETQRIVDDYLVGTQGRTLQDTAIPASAASTVQEVSADSPIVVPVVREEVRVGTRAVEGGGVRVHKRVEEREEVVEQPVFREDVSVERIAIGRPIDEAIGSRQEGDTLIVPVLEEMLVVEKRLVLKEEIRITKRRVEEIERASVILREEHVDIEQIANAAHTDTHSATTASNLDDLGPMA